MAARIIEKDLAGAVDAFSFPSVRDARLATAALATPAQLQELERHAREAAEREGREQGLAAGRAEIAERVRRLVAIADALARPLEDLDREVERQLIALATVLASHVLRRELARDALPTVDAVRQCIGALPSATREVVLHLHPDDAAAVVEQLEPQGARAWKIVRDPELERGDVTVESASSRIDGRLEARLKEIVAAALVDAGGGSAR